MKKGREFRNKPVIEADKGKLIGYVKELKTTPDNLRVEGLYTVMTSGETLFIPFANIKSLGRDAVLVEEHFLSPGADLGGERAPGTEEFASELTGTPVLTLSGENLGVIKDVVIEEKDGSIVGYEVTDGYLKDLFIGRRIVSRGYVLSAGSDAVILLDNANKLED